MISIKDILYRVHTEEIQGDVNTMVNQVCLDSRKVSKGTLFVAIKGSQSDGHNFIAKAEDSGAIAIVCSTLPENANPKITYIKVPDTAEALGHIAANFYGNPSDDIKVIAVTGTNGKTTTATLLYQLFSNLGYSCGLISTVVNKIGKTSLESTHTTPDAVSLQNLLREMCEAGCEFCFMEASSHAIHQHRVTGLNFAGAAFTNISHDHLDYHGTFAEYIKSKKALFDRLGRNAFALTNHDDTNGEIMVQNCKARVKRYALKSMADYRARVLENNLQGLHLMIDGADLYSKLVGSFNAYNILAVYAICRELGLEKLEVLTALSAADPVAGRFQHFRSTGGITAVVDYAHTPDALENVLKTIKDIRTGNERVITVVGCGGDRDKSKRPEMARIAAQWSDQVVLTSDNPRSEEPDQIIKDMEAGLDSNGKRKTLSITDRREAIRLSCTLAQSEDIILIAGKGHEKYQEIKGVKSPFDDLQIVQETIKNLGK